MIDVFISLATFICYHCLDPPLCALQIPIALDMAKDSNERDHELKKRLQEDHYMVCAVRECYASCKNIIKFLVLGDREQV